MSKSKRLWILATDEQNSVLHTLKQDELHSEIFTPYGYRCDRADLSSLLGFNGEISEKLTEHYLLGNGYRAYSPVLMRFISPDNLSPFAQGGLNPYAYCEGDPVNFSDPSGHFLSATRNFLRSPGQFIRRRMLHAEIDQIFSKIKKHDWSKYTNDTLQREQWEFVNQQYADPPYDVNYSIAHLSVEQIKKLPEHRLRANIPRELLVHRIKRGPVKDLDSPYRISNALGGYLTNLGTKKIYETPSIYLKALDIERILIIKSKNHKVIKKIEIQETVAVIRMNTKHRKNRTGRPRPSPYPIL